MRPELGRCPGDQGFIRSSLMEVIWDTGVERDLGDMI